MNLPIGAHSGIPAGLYHTIDAASASALRVINSSTPAHLQWQRDKIDKPSIDLVMGTLIHSRILEPGQPLPAVAVVPETYVVPADYKGTLRDPKPGDVEPWNNRRKFCQQWRQAQEAAGLIVLEREQLDEIDRAAEAVQRNTEARELLEGAQTEVTLRWETLDGFPCKARLDIVPARGVLADLKTTTDASPRGFAKSAFDLGYHLQAAWYLDGFDAVAEARSGFSFIAYEKGPGLVTVHHCTRDFIDAGREAYGTALALYRQCVENDTWPGYQSACMLDVPRWARKEALL